MWDLIVSVPDHCLSFYFVLSVFIVNLGDYHATRAQISWKHRSYIRTSLHVY